VYLSGYLQKSDIFLDGDETKNIQISCGTRDFLTPENSDILIGAKPSEELGDVGFNIGIGINTTSGGDDNIVIGHNTYVELGTENIIIGNHISVVNPENQIIIGRENVSDITLGFLNITYTGSNKLIFTVLNKKIELQLI
jgi:hypothetical protein